MKVKTIIKVGLAILFLGLLTAGVRLVDNWFSQQQANGQKIGALEQRLNSLESLLREEIGKAPIVQEEAVRREVVKQKSQEELLTAAVAKVAPAVVSIVVSKDVPKLEVVYVNPFGNDPFFEDFGVRVPMYRQRGTQKQKVGAGTGFLISSNGYVLTNRHVVEDQAATYTVLLSNGAQKLAQVSYVDQKLDVAIIKIDGSGYNTVSLGDS